MFKTKIINNEIVLVTPPQMSLLSEFFEVDIQESIEVCDYYLDLIDKIKNDISDDIDSVGNAFNIYINKEYVGVSNEYTEESLSKIKISDFIDCLNIWKSAIKLKKGV
ncbi:hypothetical protein [Acinetobacter shaoyimingii]|uniref:Uncharacterized protein n=1 Tax=Acinetobacter shaoyimingii TaxID=2715164 RepID=A0A6G8RVJ1_9GAMM|nr:hypothetical protein [Acinetobacter shaoyimingii]QIO05897.1 hypothetical protein G8E00_08015 [Acinetobacter shaoyimingii]